MTESEIKTTPPFQDMQRVLLFGFALLCAILLVSTNASSVDALLAKIGFTILLLCISVQDWRTRTVSAAITLPWMLIAVARAIAQRDPMLLPFWLGIFWLWRLHIYGGGDAKLLMGLFGLWPDLRLLWITSGALIVTGLPLLILKYARVSPRVLASGLAVRLTSGALLPTDEELNRGAPFAFAYCLAGAIYLWTQL